MSDENKMNRRDFLGTAAAAAAFTIVPRHVMGGAKFVAPSDKINCACIGTGTQGIRVMLGMLKEPQLQITTVCDPVKDDNRYLTWSPYGLRNQIRKAIDEPGWDEGVEGCRAGREPAKQIVNTWYGKQKGMNYKGCSAYADFRQCLEKEKDLDAVIIGSTDHQHAQIAARAMKMGKHVFCQKPMTNSVYEARLLAETAKQTGVATQVATGPSSSKDTDVLCEMVASGAIGPVRRVHNWSNRPVWPSGIKKLPEAEPTPEGFDWDLWLGPAKYRPFSYKYTHTVWRAWYDFGAGAIGDMGCYSIDVIYRALKLGSPETVEANGSFFCDVIDEIPTRVYNKIAHPRAMTAHFTFGARASMPPVELFWYDGGMRPAKPPELDEDGKDMPEEGMLFVGDKGKILATFHGRKPRLIPKARNNAYTRPPQTIERSSGHTKDWVNACKGGKPARANFEVAGPVTETLCLGVMAMRTKKKLKWDPVNMKTNSQAANELIKPNYRQGWEV